MRIECSESTPELTRRSAPRWARQPIMMEGIHTRNPNDPLYVQEREEGDEEDIRERLELEYTGKLDDYNSQRLLEKPALNEEEARYDGNKKIPGTSTTDK